VIPSVSRIVLETRIEFVTEDNLSEIQSTSPRRPSLISLTGFETCDPHIRDHVLVKHESLDTFMEHLDIIARRRASLTSYVLFKAGSGI